jgi:hypothetical protein
VLYPRCAGLDVHKDVIVACGGGGVYWKPVWHILEADFELVLANAQHIRNVPGRKTDVNAATWIAYLLAHGLIRSIFVPLEPRMIELITEDHLLLLILEAVSLTLSGTFV